MNEERGKLYIIYMKDGYNVICSDGTPMSFVDQTPTTGIKELKQAIKICTDHEYAFEVI